MLEWSDQAVTIPLLHWQTEPAVAAAFVAAAIAAVASSLNWSQGRQQLTEVKKSAKQAHDRSMADTALRLIQSGDPGLIEAGVGYMEKYLDSAQPEPLVLELALSIVDAYTRRNSTLGGKP